MSCPPARALIPCPLHPRSKVQTSRTVQSADELMPQTSLALGLAESKSSGAARITGTHTPSQEILPRGNVVLRCCNLIFFFFPPFSLVSILSLFSFRLNVQSRSGGERRQPLIPHNSLFPPVKNIHFVLAAASPSRGAGREERWEQR